MENNKKNRPIRSFVRRQGRITKSQVTAFDTLFPLYGLSVKNGLLNFETIFQNINPVVLEIGFGMGASLVEMAVQQADINFIGVEVHRPGVGACLNAIHQRQLENLHVFCEDVNDVLTQCLSDHSLEKVQIFFPDPWPKKRHHKRRLIQKAFLELLHQKLKPNGILHVATDWENYAEHVVSVVEETNLFEKTDSVLTRPTTKFEKRGQRLGHAIVDLCYLAR